MKRSAPRSGFTLVELLVVITIIGMLVALLLPAVISSRATARRVQCINNQKELGSAVVQYSTAKQRLPGWRNVWAGNRNYSWVMAVLPNLGREQIWQEWRANNAPNPWPYIDQLACPANQASHDTPAGLSYVANATGGGNAVPLFPDRQSNPNQYTRLSDIGSQTQTVLLSERVTPEVGPWTDTSQAQKLAFAATYQAGAKPYPWSGLVSDVVNSNHPDGTVVTFADGHVEVVFTEAKAQEYRWTPKN